MSKKSPKIKIPEMPPEQVLKVMSRKHEWKSDNPNMGRPPFALKDKCRASGISLRPWHRHVLGRLSEELGGNQSLSIIVRALIEKEAEERGYEREGFNKSNEEIQAAGYVKPIKRPRPEQTTGVVLPSVQLELPLEYSYTNETYPGLEGC